MLTNYANEFTRLHGNDPVLCNSVNDYLGLQVTPIVVEEKKTMESIEETMVNPSNGQPPYKQIKTRNAEFSKKPEDTQWVRVSSWRTIETKIQEVSQRENVVVVDAQHDILNNQNDVLVNKPNEVPPIQQTEVIININKKVEVNEVKEGKLILILI